MKVEESKAEIWRKHIESARSFPGTAREYCERHSLQVQSFYQWRKRLFAVSGLKRSSFVPVVMSRVEPEPLRRTDLPDAQWTAEFILHLLRGRS